jgi:hypothetical protein
VFGHTHRPRVAVFSPVATAECTIREVNSDTRMQLRPKSVFGAVLANPGSVGQSRSADKASTMMTLSVGDDVLEIAFSCLAYDVEAHCRTIQTSSMSEQTKLKLLGFFG